LEGRKGEEEKMQNKEIRRSENKNNMQKRMRLKGNKRQGRRRGKKDKGGNIKDFRM
jgi:hypothetical protein